MFQAEINISWKTVCRKVTLSLGKEHVWTPCLHSTIPLVHMWLFITLQECYVSLDIVHICTQKTPQIIVSFKRNRWMWAFGLVSVSSWSKTLYSQSVFLRHSLTSEPLKIPPAGLHRFTGDVGVTSLLRETEHLPFTLPFPSCVTPHFCFIVSHLPCPFTSCALLFFSYPHHTWVVMFLFSPFCPELWGDFRFQTYRHRNRG